MIKTVKIHLDINLTFEIDLNYKNYKGLYLEEVVETVAGGTKIDIEKAIQHRLNPLINSMEYMVTLKGVVK